jgi:hypothetical protein
VSLGLQVADGSGRPHEGRLLYGIGALAHAPTANDEGDQRAAAAASATTGALLRPLDALRHRDRLIITSATHNWPTPIACRKHRDGPLGPVPKSRVKTTAIEFPYITPCAVWPKRARRGRDPGRPGEAGAGAAPGAGARAQRAPARVRARAGLRPGVRRRQGRPGRQAGRAEHVARRRARERARAQARGRGKTKTKQDADAPGRPRELPFTEDKSSEAA